MKYLIAFMLVLISGMGIFCFLYSPKKNIALEKKITEQPNPFSVPKNSSELVWQRAFSFLESRKNLILGGEKQVTDSTIFIPYSNPYRRGSSIQVRRKAKADSVVFIINWWYSEKEELYSAKEMALFMKTGINKYQAP